MITRLGLQDLFARLSALAPHGHAAGLHIRAATPLIMVMRYPEAWAREYSSHSYYLCDPTVIWGMGNTGVRRWSELDVADPQALFARIATHGLRHGAVCACGPVTARSILSIAHAEREFTQAELDAFRDLAAQLHEAAEPPRLTRAQTEALTLVANGVRHSAAAEQIGITESAFKARLATLRQRLDARTNAEAVRLAREMRIL